ncbi:hypothetical protein CEUSTIGMA_g10352.t1 [Chlamydomonas eustigma]|uniref:Uncharacterized protein n=1 Tax=Chlamydomonas eustigma TaxID=1157962 RepID=A0A250XIL5_9CHLO|nr:hypothetical protein CEUSTIGMA_g10352.t1 [Chlamydomonas eustigma]|eukprot:GAX82925.1 hypothetical protein CEUSTIGMA_g10352.t1 [Chlamydomonas eustigma]
MHVSLDCFESPQTSQRFFVNSMSFLSVKYFLRYLLICYSFFGLATSTSFPPPSPSPIPPSPSPPSGLTCFVTSFNQVTGKCQNLTAGANSAIIYPVQASGYLQCPLTAVISMFSVIAAGSDVTYTVTGTLALPDGLPCTNAAVADSILEILLY